MTTELETPDTDTAVLAIVTPTSLDLTTKERVLASIEERRADFAAITIAGVDDKKGMQAAKAARRLLRTVRVKINELRESLNEDALKTQRENNAAAKELITLIASIEDPLDEKIKAIEKEVADERIRAQKVHADMLQARIMSLISIGGSSAHGTYSAHGVQVDALDLQDMSDEQWALVMVDVNEAYNAKLLAEQEAERVRVAELDALNKQKQEQAERQRKLDEREKALAAAALKLRTDTLTSLGWELDGPYFSHEGRAELRLVEVGNTDDETFAEWVADFKQWKVDEANKAEQQRAALGESKQRLKMRADALVDHGWVYADGGYTFEGTGAISVQEIMNMDADDFADMIVEWREWKFQQDTEKAESEAIRLVNIEQAEIDRVTAEKQRVADEKATRKADKERAARLKADKKILIRWTTLLSNFPVAEGLEQPETLALKTRLIGKLSLLADELRADINAL